MRIPTTKTGLAHQLMIGHRELPLPRAQRLYGDPGDAVMKLADGTSCRVEPVAAIDVDCNETMLERVVATHINGNNIGYLPQETRESHYHIDIYRIEQLEIRPQ